MVGLRPDDPNRIIRLINLQTGETIPYETDQPMARSVVSWSPDSKSLFAGHLYRVNDDGGLQAEGNFGTQDTWYTGFGQENDVFVGGFNQATLNVVSPTGDLKSVIQFNPSYTIQNVDPSSNNRQTHENSLMTLLSSPQCDALNVIDTEQDQFRWTGFAFHDGETLTLSPAGKIIDGPQDSTIDRYVIHTIRYPGGQTIPLTRRQFLDRITATKPQRALYWALDHGAKIKVGEQVKPFEYDKWNTSLANLPSSTTVTSVELANALEITADELHQLTEFKNLESLRLNGSQIDTIPDLKSLGKLSTLDLSQTNVTDLKDKLPTSLQHLSMADTKVTPDIGSVLRTLPELVSLDLSGTNVDNFTLLDLESIQTLRELKLLNVEIPEADIERLKTKLPDCRIETTE